MRILGQVPVRFPGKTDCHPKRKFGWVNWWEIEINFPFKNRAREKRDVEKEIAVQKERI